MVSSAGSPRSPRAHSRAAVAPAGQSVGYVLGVDGRLARTLSAGRAPATATLGKSRITSAGPRGSRRP